MTTAMGPPPPRSSNPTTSSEPKTLDEPSTSSSSSETTMKTTMSMGPPPKEPSFSEPEPPPPQPRDDAGNEKAESNSVEPEVAETGEPSGKQSSHQSQRHVVPYTIPPWSGAPGHNFYFEVLKEGSIIDQFDVYEKGAFMFGRVDLCDFILDHPTISRFHAVLQFKRSGQAYIYDLGSTHGTFINKNQVKKKSYVDLHVGDVVRFGQSSRLYIFQGPTDLMPPEADLKRRRDVKIREEMLDREASLQRARREASLAEGVSWGMGEDAIEEAEDDGDEVTWQTYKGQLAEKQEKTREKVIKRMEKIAHMKKEIDAIRAKDISQGGLTQGQQTQIARNEQRITQIMEELESLEETLNESIRESIGARVGKFSHGNKKGATEEDDEFLSDDDEFYDRTKKKASGKKAGENQSVETVDTLLDKRDAIMKEIEDKKELLSTEKNKIASVKTEETETGDALDAFMSGISSQLVIDKTTQLQEELLALQPELDRILYLLKIADPTGEAAKKRDLKVQEPKANKAPTPAPAIKKQRPREPKESNEPGKPANDVMKKEEAADETVKSDKKPEADEIVQDAAEGKTAVYVATKPQWLGAVDNRHTEENQRAAPLNVQDSDDFVDYKDRNKVLGNADDLEIKVEPGIENAAAGLIIRKRKQVKELEGNNNDTRQQPTSTTASAEVMAMDAVALLLKHQKGHYASDEENGIECQETLKEHKRPKRVLGPEKPSFLDSSSDSDTWVPPEGQSGDGRTTLNDRFGY
ncbi:Serine/threonine protein kinase [Trema orientale]|uniref:Serine/threonine protein kinase n=1 Tax=Trema orientale TaxID=63057 RepID=A0A2P5E9E3_TREOI|nr:Serine/threonine protein kinase [Trema orientale]